MNSRTSINNSESKYNFTKQSGRNDDDNQSMMSRSRAGGSRAGGNSRANSRAGSQSSRRSSVNSDNDDVRSRTSRHTKASRQTKVSHQQSTKSPTKVGAREKQDYSKLASIVKQEFAEDSREDESDSEQSSDDEEEKKRKWQENIYYYTCPVFRVSITFKNL